MQGLDIFVTNHPWITAFLLLILYELVVGLVNPRICQHCYEKEDADE